MNNTPPQSNLFEFTIEMTILSNIPKPKILVLSSTLHHDDEIHPTTGDENKHDVIWFSFFTKSSVDQHCGFYAVERITKR